MEVKYAFCEMLNIIIVIFDPRTPTIDEKYMYILFYMIICEPNGEKSVFWGAIRQFLKKNIFFFRLGLDLSQETIKFRCHPNLRL